MSNVPGHEGHYVSAVPVLDPAASNVNCHPMDWSLGQDNFLMDQGHPSAPVAVSLTGKTATTVSLAWSSKGVGSYNLYNGNSKLGSTTNAQATISGLVTTTAYSLSVTWVDEQGNESAKSNVVAVTTS